MNGGGLTRAMDTVFTGKENPVPANDLLDRLLTRPRPPEEMEQAPPIELVAIWTAILRRTRGWKQSTLAHTAGVSLSSVARLERGGVVRPEVIDKIGAALGMEPGTYTTPRRLRSAEEATAFPPRGWPHLVLIDVARPKTQHQLRALARCERLVILAPHITDADRPLLSDLAESIDYLGFVLADLTGERRQDTGRRRAYAFALEQVERFNRMGYHVLAGVTEQSLKEGKPEQIALFAITAKALDPEALGRRRLILDWRDVAEGKLKSLLGDGLTP